MSTAKKPTPFENVVPSKDLQHFSISTENNNLKLEQITVAGNQMFVTQTPYLVTKSGWTETVTNSGKNTYFVSCSTEPFKCESEDDKYKQFVSKNTELTQKWKDFVSNVDEYILEAVKQKWQSWTGKPAPSDDVLREYQTSMLKKEKDGYAESYMINFKDYMTSKGEFQGGIFEQSFDQATQTPNLSARPKVETTMKKLYRNARIRFELHLKGFYFADIPQNDYQMQKYQFGAQWAVLKVIYYNTNTNVVPEDILKLNTFEDIETNVPANSTTTKSKSVVVVNNSKKRTQRDNDLIEEPGKKVAF